MLGLVGNVFGQSDSLKQFFQSNQDSLKYQNTIPYQTNPTIGVFNREQAAFSSLYLSPDSVVILRNQLVENLEKGNIEEVRKIKNILWDVQQVKGENLSYPEYWLILFWTKEYDKLLFFRNYSYKIIRRNKTETVIKLFSAALNYPTISPFLQMKTKNNKSFLQSQLEIEKYGSDLILLNEMLSALLDSSGFDNKKKHLEPVSAGYISLILHSDYSPIIGDYYSKQEHTKKPNNFGFGLGLHYQWDLYDGEISNYISNHGMFMYPCFCIDFYIEKVFFQMFWVGFGTLPVNSVNINGDIFEGTFYGDYFTLFNMTSGYEAYNNSYISIIPNIGFQPNRNYTFYPGLESGKIDNDNQLLSILIASYSLGFIADYKILKMNVFDNSYLSIRFKYDYCFTARKYEYYNGIIHQFTIGLNTTFRNKKNK